MSKISVISKVYANRRIKLDSEIIEFKGINAEISEELFEKLQKEGFSNIVKKGESLSKAKSENLHEDDDELIKKMREEYLTEIDRLNNLIDTKNKIIEEKDIQINVWKEQVEELKKGLTKKVDEKIIKETTSNESEEVEKLRADLLTVSLKELKELAKDEGIDEKIIKETTSNTKSNLIELLINKSIV